MKKKILLADDSVTIQRVVELTFSEQGYDVTCLRSGAEVLDAGKVKSVRASPQASRLS